eukprot:3496999-Pleurochrysis_carterae.AAC.2
MYAGPKPCAHQPELGGAGQPAYHCSRPSVAHRCNIATRGLLTALVCKHIYRIVERIFDSGYCQWAWLVVDLKTTQPSGSAVATTYRPSLENRILDFSYCQHY